MGRGNGDVVGDPWRRHGLRCNSPSGISFLLHKKNSIPIEANGVFTAASESGCGLTEGREYPLPTGEEGRGEGL